MKIWLVVQPLNLLYFEAETRNNFFLYVQIYWHFCGTLMLGVLLSNWSQQLHSKFIKIASHDIQNEMIIFKFKKKKIIFSKQPIVKTTYYLVYKKKHLVTCYSKIKPETLRTLLSLTRWTLFWTKKVVKIDPA